jgi:hypothetical protein
MNVNEFMFPLHVTEERAKKSIEWSKAHSTPEDTCESCVDCEDCTSCISCADLTSCTVCITCRYCKQCDDCVDCSKCTGCLDCTECTSCDNCTHCIGLIKDVDREYVAFDVQMTQEMYEIFAENYKAARNKVRRK